MGLFSDRVSEGVEPFPHRRIVVCVSATRQFDTLRPSRYLTAHL
jgi:hypothetical protein